VDAATGEFRISRRDGGGSFNATLAGDTLSFDGLTLQVSDTTLLMNGDNFQLQPTRQAAVAFNNMIKDPAHAAAGQSTASGDNRNALALLDIQNGHVFGGRFTLTQGYMGLVNEVGNRSNVVQINLKAQEALTDQIHMLQQSESGVNLDEEAVNLIRFQQYYQANAKVIETGGMLLDVILALR
jgi:flagellar hook-associated protein 1 FlgK